MSCELISRSADLAALKIEGFEIAVIDGFLVVTNIPYVTSTKEVKRGTLMSPLTTAGDVAAVPGTHVVHFNGEFPCHRDGAPIEALRHGTNRVQLSPRLTADHSFSNKPQEGYADYQQLVTTYATIISAPATSLDPTAIPRTFGVVETLEDDSVFRYVDTASSRAGIAAASAVLAQENVAIVGLGGTGSYVLDLVAKTPVKTIHLFDGDRLLTHNAFRSPGAMSLEQLRGAPTKVEYFGQLYDRMRRNIVAYPVRIDDTNVHLLQRMDFVFVCVDNGPARKLIIDALLAAGVSFVDVGMGVQQVDDQLLGIVRVTANTSKRPAAFVLSTVVPCAEVVEDDAYDKNIQLADLNALNAALAVIRWKKSAGFYQDFESEHHSTYSTNVNLLTSDGCP